MAKGPYIHVYHNFLHFTRIRLAHLQAKRHQKTPHLSYLASDTFQGRELLWKKVSKTLQHLEGFFLLRSTTFTDDFTTATLLQANCQARQKCLD